MFVTSVEYGQVHRFGVQDLGSAGFGGVWISVSVDKPRFKLVQSSLHFGSIQHYNGIMLLPTNLYIMSLRVVYVHVGI